MQVLASGGAGKIGEQGESSQDLEEVRKASHTVLHRNLPLPADNYILEQKAVSM